MSPEAVSDEGTLEGLNAPPEYARTPRRLLRDPTISSQAKTLWSLLEDHASPSAPVPWPGQERLGKMLGVTSRTVRRWQAELTDAGWLVVRQTGRSNRFYLVWDPPDRTSVSDRDRTSVSDRSGRQCPSKKNQEEEPVKNEQVPAKKSRKRVGISTRARPNTAENDAAAGNQEADADDWDDDWLADTIPIRADTTHGGWATDAIAGDALMTYTEYITKQRGRP